MTTIDPKLAQQIARRRTFAIISHPDAGKTTLTEKLLLYSRALRMAGSVKARRATRHAKSDWMAMEQERGISVTTSVLQFEYRECHMNLLDTPGHNDFSEDTYRTLTAADSAIMLIDSVKGVEPQTIKLFEVCRMRGIPIVTFVNKMDRLGRDPLELCEQIEQVLGIPTAPANWPIGSGPGFQGVYDRWSQELLRFERSDGGARMAPVTVTTLDDPAFRASIGDSALEELMESLELLDGAGDEFDQDAFLAGEITPVFFGSAMTNFGVEPFLNRFVELAPSPRARASGGNEIDPAEPEFSGFVFKIQANMDPRHRDRIAFVRICSGQFTRGMNVTHQRLGKSMNLARPLQFMAQERMLIDKAVAGDILGLWDSGQLRIGDTLSEGMDVRYDGVPRFSPEHFVRANLLDPLRRKQLKKGLEQLSEEGAVQVFYDRFRLERDPILGAVGLLQFDVVKHRLANEYNVNVGFDRLSYRVARWIQGEADLNAVERASTMATVMIDIEGRPIVISDTQWIMNNVMDKFPDLTFVAAVQPGRKTG
jgi:peptide chain release factor 3